MDYESLAVISVTIRVNLTLKRQDLSDIWYKGTTLLRTVEPVANACQAFPSASTCYG